MMRLLPFAFFLSFLCLISCSTTSDPTEKYKGFTAEQLFHKAEVALADGSYSTAIQSYEALDALYPFNAYSEQALLGSIYAYSQSGDNASSAAAAQRFIHLYPASKHLDYAYYMKGVSEMLQDRTWTQRYFPIDLATRDPGSARQAYIDFAELIQLFPQSIYAPHAQQRMIYLRNRFAQAELDVARFYLKRHAYVAAVNRGTYIVKHYDGTPAVKSALEIMVKAYRAMGENAEADRIWHVLQFNYPVAS